MARSASGLCAGAAFTGVFTFAAGGIGALVHTELANAKTSVSQTDPEGVIHRAVNALINITNFAIITARQAARRAFLALLVGCSISREAEFTTRSACDRTVSEVHQVLGVLEVVPTRGALRSVTSARLAGVFTLKLGSQNEVVQFVHNKGL